MVALKLFSVSKRYVNFTKQHICLYERLEKKASIISNKISKNIKNIIYSTWL